MLLCLLTIQFIKNKHDKKPMTEKFAFSQFNRLKNQTSVAQRIRPMTVKRGVIGSSPRRRSYTKALLNFYALKILKHASTPPLYCIGYLPHPTACAILNSDLLSRNTCFLTRLRYVLRGTNGKKIPFFKQVNMSDGRLLLKLE